MPTERYCMDLGSVFSVLHAQLDAVAISTRMWGLGVSYSSFNMDRSLVHVTQMCFCNTACFPSLGLPLGLIIVLGAECRSELVRGQ